jgi:hypothetical protein
MGSTLFLLPCRMQLAFIVMNLRLFQGLIALEYYLHLIEVTTALDTASLRKLPISYHACV